MSKSIKFLLVLTLIYLGVGVTLVATAQENQNNETNTDVQLDETITADDLGITEPTLLPDSPFYFLKDWGRGIQSFFTFDKVKKAELKMKFANEKLIEVKKLIEENKDPKIIGKGLKKYEEEIDKIEKTAEKIKDKASNNPNLDKFSDKFIKQQVLQEKILQKLETQVPPEVFEKIKEAREKHLEKFGEVMTKLEEQDKIPEKLEKNLEELKGSKFKNFKNLEILKNLEEKVPEEAKEAIQKAQENALKRLKGDLEKMSSEDQEKFKDYIDKISGNKEKQLEVLENLKSEIQKLPETQKTIKLKEKLEEGKIKVLEKLQQKECKKDDDCPKLKCLPNTKCIGEYFKCIGGKCKIISITPGTCDLKCENFRYSTCPEGCVKKCIPSQCSGNVCTSDCEGSGSCLCP